MTIPSVLVYAAAWAARVCLNLAPRQALREGGARELPVEVRKVGKFLAKAAWVLLCSGSYVLCDVVVPEEKVRVRITLI